ncbi:MAG: hypothetical protein Q3983_06060 [Capnocytophaga sp.]|nr:hypothetical protein [Capnocytophaga sp.]
MNKILGILFFFNILFAIAQPKLGQTWTKNELGETLETPLGFLRKEKTTEAKIDYILGIDKANKIVYIETRSPNFKVGNYSFNTKLYDFKNYTYTRFFEGWGYYLRLNDKWCAYFGKGKPNKDSKPILYFNYNFGKVEGKPIFDSNYEEVLAAQQKAEKEKQAKKAKEKEEQAKRKADFEAEQKRLEKEKQAKEKAETERKLALQKQVELRKKQEEEKKKAEEEKKRKYAEELAEYNAKKEAEKKAKEAERMRKSEEFRTGQKIVNTETTTTTAPSTGTKTSAKLSNGEKLLDEVLQSRLKKGLKNYLDYINKNKKYTEAYPLVLVNYKDLTKYSSAELAKISKIVSTTVFKKGAKRTEDFKEDGKNGVVIIKVEF